MLNTLRVAVIGIVLATLLGTLIGIGRLSKNWLVARLTSIYVEVMRNVPLLLQLFFWYALITENMPGPRQAHTTPCRACSSPIAACAFPAWKATRWTGCWAGWRWPSWPIIVLGHWGRKRQEATGRIFPLGRAAIALLIGLPIVGWLASGASLALDIPALKGFNFQGGLNMSPEFAALLAGLVIYTSAFVAEVVRSGIQAVNQGQWEAAGSLGLRRAQVLRLVVAAAGAARHHPPMTSQYLNLTRTVRWPWPSAIRTSSRWSTPRSTRPARPSRAS